MHAIGIPWRYQRDNQKSKSKDRQHPFQTVQQGSAKSTKHYTKNWRLSNAKNQWWTQLPRKDSRRVVLFKSGDKTWKGLRRTRLWLRQTEINLKYSWSCVTHDFATVSEEMMATVCSDYRNVLLMESSQWENWNHLFCDAVSFHPVPWCWSRYKTYLLVSVVSFILS